MAASDAAQESLPVHSPDVCPWKACPIHRKERVTAACLDNTDYQVAWRLGA